jgi:hypothetical protein
MANIISRFRRRKAAPQSDSPSGDPIYVEDKNVPIPSEKATGVSELAADSSESKTSQNHDPELAIDPTAVDEESLLDEDLRDIPVEVRNTVSFEDDQSLPTITFRYFVLTFVFVAPGAFLYQMVSTTAEPRIRHQC